MNETFWGLYEAQISALRNCASPEEANLIMLETAKLLVEHVDQSEGTIGQYDKFGIRKLFAAHNALGGAVTAFYDAQKVHLDWSNGQLSTVAAAVEQLCGLMERINDVPTAELVSALERIKELRELLDKAREDAKDALVSSQMRAEMASTMAEHLQMAGWEFAGYTYEGSEMNAALHVKFRDNMGNEIVTVISPENHYGELCNNMQVNFFDPYNNDECMRGIWVDGILESLRDVGLNVGKPITQPGFEIRQSDNEAIRDLDATASRKAKG